MVCSKLCMLLLLFSGVPNRSEEHSNWGSRHMAADEMQTITSDKWSDDVWGMSNVKDPVTQLFFYFGRNDHWVAERTRDEVIELRGRTEGSPKMVVCEEGLPHAFVLSESLCPVPLLEMLGIEFTDVGAL